MKNDSRKLIELLLERDWDQTDLKKNSGLSYCAISEILSGVPTRIRLKTLAKIAKALNVSWKILVEGESNHGC